VRHGREAQIRAGRNQGCQQCGLEGGDPGRRFTRAAKGTGKVTPGIHLRQEVLGPYTGQRAIARLAEVLEPRRHLQGVTPLEMPSVAADRRKRVAG
jgi:hypothetical protein